MRRFPSRRFGQATARRFRAGTCAAALLPLLAPAVAWAGAVTDGSMGAVQSLSGNFTVPQSLGTVRGANLFHSFLRFGVAAGESATFSTSDAGIRRVISRVTGGEASAIDGPVSLQAAAGSAPEFYFVNPSGLVIGPNGRFDVPAGLHLATTPELRFADGFAWRTGGADASSLTVAAPQSFGFLAAQPAGPLRWTGGSQGVSAQQVLEIAGGDIELRRTVLGAPGGTLHLQAGGALLLADGARGQALTDASRVSGRIQVEASSLTVQGDGGRTPTGLFAETGPSGGGGITLDLAGDLALSRGAGVSLFSRAEPGGAPAAALRVSAGHLVLDPQGSSTTVGTNHSGRGSPGPDLQLVLGGPLEVGAGGSVSTYSSSSGAAGAITLSATRVTLDGGGAGGVASIGSLAAGDGAAGAVSVAAREAVVLRPGGQISSATLGAGDASPVRVASPSITVQGAAGSSTSVFSSALGDAGGNAGEVRLEAGDVSVLGNAYVSSTVSSAFGMAGPVVLRADRVLLDGQGRSGGLNSFAFGPFGGAGSLDVSAREGLTLRDGGAIMAGALGAGDTGRISVTTPLLRIQGRGAPQSFTGIGGDALGRGAAGSVQVTAGRVEVLEGGQISSSTFSQADAGSIRLSADTLHIDGGGNAGTATGLSTDSASGGRAGTISIAAREVDIVAEGAITSNTFGTGAGGAIDVRARRLTLGSGGTIFSVAAGAGNAGSITLQVDEAMTLTQGGIVTANTGGLGAAGRIGITAGSLTVEGRDAASGLGSRIVSRALAGSGGRTGQISINVSGDTMVRDGAEISIANRATVADPAALGPGTLAIKTGRLLVQDAEVSAAATGNTAASRVAVAATDGVRLERAGILTSAVDGDGGAIDLKAGGMVQLRDARITTSVEGRSSGNGGDIDIAAGALVMQSGFVQANTAAPLARGGQVRVQVPVLLPDGSRVDIGGAQIASFRPGVAGGNVIQAAAPDGVGGTLAVTLPQLDLSASLARLLVPRIDFGPLGRDMCEVGADSSFTLLGRGALPPRAGAPLGIEP